MTDSEKLEKIKTALNEISTIELDRYASDVWDQAVQMKKIADKAIKETK